MKSISTPRIQIRNGRSTCKNCEQKQTAHYRECGACPDTHAGYCSKDR